MTETLAFGGREKTKIELLRNFNEEFRGTEIWFGFYANDITRGDMTKHFALSPVLILLMKELGGDTNDTDVHEFYVGLVDAIRPNVSTLNIVRNWLLWCWNGRPESLSASIDGAKALAASYEIAGLVEQSVETEVPEEKWTQARDALEAARSQSELKNGYIDAMLAMADDIEATPTAAADVAKAWAEEIRWASNTANGWTRELEAAFMKRSMELHELTLAKVPKWTAENLDEVYPQYKAVIRELAAGDAVMSDLKARGEVGRHFGAVVKMEWIEDARQALIECASAQRV